MSRVLRIAAVFFISSVCWAGATLTMGFGVDSGCVTADECSGSPNVGLSNTSSIHNNSGGQDIPPPVLLILGVANTSGAGVFTQNSIESMYVWDPFDPDNPDDNKESCPGCWMYGTNELGITNPVSGGYYGQYSASSTGSIYDFLSLDGGASSNHFTNWSGYLSSAYGVDVDSFGIYVFALNTTLAAKGLIEVTFTNLPSFTYMAGYAQDGTQVFSTPFTRVGLHVSVPESSFGLLFSIDLLVLGALVVAISRRSKSSCRMQSTSGEVVSH